MDDERLSFCCFQYLQSTVLLTRKHHFDYFKSNTIEIRILVSISQKNTKIALLCKSNIPVTSQGTGLLPNEHHADKLYSVI